MKNAIQILAVIVIDLLAYYLSLFLGIEIRTSVLPLFIEKLPEFPFSYLYFVKLFWIPVIFIFFIANEHLYTIKVPFWDESKKMLKAITISTLVVMSIITLGKMSDKVSRVVLSSQWFLSLMIFPFFRFWGKRFLYNIGICREKVLILGAGKAGRAVLQWLMRERHIGYDVVGFLDDDPNKIGTYIEGKKVFGKLKHYKKFIKEIGIQTVIISIPSMESKKLSQLASDIQKYVKHTMVVPELHGIALLNTELLHLFYEEIFLLNIQNNLKSTLNRVIKRLFDITVSLLLLPFLLFLMVIIGIIIKIESPGPVIYSHYRIGKKGKIFKCYKFRTMQKDAEEKLQELLQKDSSARLQWEQYWKLIDDPRVTRVGRFLRKTSLDELPQILNVLKGEMSLIGPRPYLLREKDAIQDKLEIITSVAPGITGLWQVSGRNDITYQHRIKLDVWYIMNWSLWLDIYILIKTIKVVLGMRGAR